VVDQNQDDQISAWVDLPESDERALLIGLIGHSFGDQPQQHLEAIRASRVRFARRFVRMAKVKKQDVVLEIGSGCGFGTSLLAEKAGQVMACDISPAYLAFAKKQCAGLQNIQFNQIRSRSLAGFDDNSVDVAVSISVFIHLNLYDIYWYFRELSRVLKPDGRLCFDFADSEKLFQRSWLSAKTNQSRNQVFVEQAEYYLDEPQSLFQLMQWNSTYSIINIAQQCHFQFIRRRGDRLLFKKLSNNN